MTATTTGTTAGAREHARAQEADAVGTVATMPTRPARSFPTPRARSTRPRSCTRRSSPAAATRTSRSPRGTQLRLTDLQGDACAHLLLYRADRPWERLNVADTVKVQWQAYLDGGPPAAQRPGPGARDASSPTRPAGTTRCTAPRRGHATTERYGDGSAAGSDARRPRAVRARGGQARPGPRDLPPCISFFQGVRIDDDGRPVFEGSAGPGTAVTLRAERAAACCSSPTPRTRWTRAEFTSTPLEVLAWTRRADRRTRRPALGRHAGGPPRLRQHRTTT